MRLESVKVVAFTIFDAPKLDPVTVILHDLGHGSGRFIVECYGDAWSGFWGAMGDRTLQEFLIDCDPDYIVNRIRHSTARLTRDREQYLRRIVVAVQDALRTAIARAADPAEGS